jgi:hypothetical protein
MASGKLLGCYEYDGGKDYGDLEPLFNFALSINADRFFLYLKNGDTLFSNQSAYWKIYNQRVEKTWNDQQVYIQEYKALFYVDKTLYEDDPCFNSLGFTIFTPNTDSSFTYGVLQYFYINKSKGFKGEATLY